MTSLHVLANEIVREFDVWRARPLGIPRKTVRFRPRPCRKSFCAGLTPGAQRDLRQNPHFPKFFAVFFGTFRVIAAAIVRAKRRTGARATRGLSDTQPHGSVRDGTGDENEDDEDDE
jgi:hypothetical protein